MGFVECGAWRVAFGEGRVPISKCALTCFGAVRFSSVRCGVVHALDNALPPLPEMTASCSTQRPCACSGGGRNGASACASRRSAQIKSGFTIPLI